MGLGVACSHASTMTTITMVTIMVTITMATITTEGLMWIWKVSLALFAMAPEGKGKLNAPSG